MDDQTLVRISTLFSIQGKAHKALMDFTIENLAKATGRSIEAYR